MIKEGVTEGVTEGALSRVQTFPSSGRRAQLLQADIVGDTADLNADIQAFA